MEYPVATHIWFVNLEWPSCHSFDILEVFSHSQGASFASSTKSHKQTLDIISHQCIFGLFNGYCNYIQLSFFKERKDFVKEVLVSYFILSGIFSKWILLERLIWVIKFQWNGFLIVHISLGKESLQNNFSLMNGCNL